MPIRVFGAYLYLSCISNAPKRRFWAFKRVVMFFWQSKKCGAFKIFFAGRMIASELLDHFFKNRSIVCRLPSANEENRLAIRRLSWLHSTDYAKLQGTVHLPVKWNVYSYSIFRLSYREMAASCLVWMFKLYSHKE